MILAIRPYCFKVGFFKSCWRVQGEAGQKLPPSKITMSPFQKERKGLSSNQHVSGDMLVLGGGNYIIWFFFGCFFGIGVVLFFTA